MRIRSYILLTLSVSLSLLTGPVAAQDGKALYGQRLCITCHGPEGKAPIQNTYPRLAGQNQAYLLQQFKDIRDGNRTNALTGVMKGIVAKVEDAEAEAIAAYLSSIQ